MIKPGTIVVLLACTARIAASDCSVPIAFLPIANFRAHIGFRVAEQPPVNRICGPIGFMLVSGPPEFVINEAGGLFFWTPARTGTERITIRVNEYDDTFTVTSSGDATFEVVVDDKTMTAPLFRDYLAQATSVPIDGRAHGADFVSYSLEYSEDTPGAAPHLIAGPITQPVEETGRLADWDISRLPDGGRYLLALRVQLAGGDTSVLTNSVILDRSAKPGWPKRIDVITHSLVAADIAGDAREEILTVTGAGDLYAWSIDGTELWEAEEGNGSYSAPSVGEIDGDGRPDVVWSTLHALQAHHGDDGTRLAGFPYPAPVGLEFRTVPTLADLDGDGRLDILVGASEFRSDGQAGHAQVHAYHYDGGTVVPLPGWPQVVDHFSLYASASVGDLDGRPGPEVVVESYDRVYAWHADGTPLETGLHRARLAAKIDNAETNGAGLFFSSSQPALADLDRDGVREIVVGSNVLRLDGTPVPGWEGGRPEAVNSLSPAIGDLDGDPANGLEVVLGSAAWHADGTPVAGRPFEPPLSSAVLGDCGDGDLDTLASRRLLFGLPPGIEGVHADGRPLAGYPKSLFGVAGDVGAPVIGDFDRDGLVDVAAAITDAAYGGVVAVWNMPGAYHPERQPWPMLGHDVRHTGYFVTPTTTSTTTSTTTTTTPGSMPAPPAREVCGNCVDDDGDDEVDLEDADCCAEPTALRLARTTLGRTRRAGTKVGLHGVLPLADVDPRVARVIVQLRVGARAPLCVALASDRWRPTRRGFRFTGSGGDGARAATMTRRRKGTIAFDVGGVRVDSGVRRREEVRVRLGIGDRCVDGRVRLAAARSR